jgi:TRAP-type C4-dicarboxylate transport system permease small subunit
MDRWNRLVAPLRALCALLMIAIFVLSIAQVVFRFLLDSPLIWSEELARLSLIWLTFLGAAVVCFDGTHLQVDSLFLLLPAGGRRVVRAINTVLALGFVVILAWYSVPLIVLGQQGTGALDLPFSVYRLPALIGGVLMAAAIVLRRLRRGARDAQALSAGHRAEMM